MPFKLKLKRSRHYSVVSKSLFVISVEMLDTTIVECTLSSESTGSDCLDVVCQKLGLNQSKLFGLQYMSKLRDNYYCWLELEKPIKRQLDKHARGLYAYLKVMYYVLSGIRHLTDEVTRYHYFLQLKMDVIEGKISCTPQQAVELASYCMQAEFGNFDPERHTAHYLKDFQLFPKIFIDPSLLETLTDAASRQHSVLQNVPQGTAEEYYICACQKLAGYGQETFNVKERNGDLATIGVSLTGLIVSYSNSNRRNRIYRWVDIGNVINHKKDFTIESNNSNGSEKSEFHFSDAEGAKNAWRFCVLQHMFYREYEMENLGLDRSDKVMTSFRQGQIEEKLRQMDSYEDITNLQSQSQWDMMPNGCTNAQSLTQRAQSTSCLNLNMPTDIDKLRSLLPSYRPAPDYETAVQQKYRNSAGAIQNIESIRTQPTILYSSQPEIHQMTTSNETFNHLQSYPDVTHNNIEQKTILSSIYNNRGYGRTQIDTIDQKQMNDNFALLHLYKPPPPYPTNRISSNSTPDLAGICSQQPQINFVNNVVSGSSPDLVSSGNFINQQYLKQQLQYNDQFQLCHPVHRSHSYLPPPQQQHGTYENLASIFNNNLLMQRPQAAVIVENPNVTKHIKKVYDEHGNIIYCMPANMKQILQENQLPSTGFVVTRNQNALVAHSPQLNDSNEPIYENVPLPLWLNESNATTFRERTQSIHSAPEVVFNAHHLTQNNGNSKENLYANLNCKNTNLNTNLDTKQTNLDGKETNLEGKETNFDEKQTNFDVNNVNFTNSFNEEPSPTMSRTNTFIVNKNSALNSTFIATSSPTQTYGADNSTTTTTLSDLSTSNNSSSSSTKVKKKRWGLLIGKGRSTEKIKSATLGREKDKNKDNQQNVATTRHRWSTGLPRFHPLPPSISKETMCQLLENKLADSQLFFEFDKIPKKKQNADFTTAMNPDNAALNRFKDVLPYDDNRLKLTPTKDNRSGYINASQITATVGSKQKFYVAAQGPTRSTLSYFWQCVWEAEVYLVVQLTDQTEGLEYLPDADERCKNIGQDYQVWWEFSQKTGHCVTSKVRLCHVTSRRYRTIWHLNYNEWGDQGCPHSVAHFLGFLEEMQSVQQYSMTEIPHGHNKNPPVLIHCTAGVGRTGLTILADLLLFTVTHNQEVDIPRVVGLLRHQRPYMVQTIAQYRFIYSLLIHYLKQTRLI